MTSPYNLIPPEELQAHQRQILHRMWIHNLADKVTCSKCQGMGCLKCNNKGFVYVRITK